jgi:formate--tetrahydrofolate ligase
MAIFCLATDLEDLQRRIGAIVVGTTRELEPVTCKQIGADGAMTALLKDALMPNLVQTLEGTPAFIHGGPFANIAHGCNSVMATTAGLKLADYVVTEAGFGADLGAEKFLDIKCRKTGLTPSAVTIVATVRALKMHGGVPKDKLAGEDVDAVKRGFVNLERHLQNIAKFGLPAVVAINKFTLDTPAEIAAISAGCEAMGVKVIECSHWANGGEGTRELAEEIVRIIEKGENNFKFLYDDKLSLYEKVQTIAKEIYRADGISCDAKVMKQFQEYQERYGHFPVCMAKTQYSFSTDPTKMGAPTGHTIPVRELRLSAGAEFIVAICGDIMTMPGLPKKPAAESIRVSEKGQIEGLF